MAAAAATPSPIADHDKTGRPRKRPPATPPCREKDMTQLELIPMTPTEKGTPGSSWWAGAWECRNFEGFYQVREQGRGPWQFVIHGFGEDDVSVFGVNPSGTLFHRCVPIDQQDRITVHGRKYGRDNWQH